MQIGRQTFGTCDVIDTMRLGDCKDLLRSLPDASVDLVVSSPPYNIGKEYEIRQSLERYLAAQADVLREAVRVLKPHGSSFWQAGSFSDPRLLTPLVLTFFPLFVAL